MAFAAAWWWVGLGIVGGVAAFAALWRFALEDLVLSSVELPSCERAPRPPQAVAHTNGHARG